MGQIQSTIMCNGTAAVRIYEKNCLLCKRKMMKRCLCVCVCECSRVVSESSV